MSLDNPFEPPSSIGDKHRSRIRLSVWFAIVAFFSYFAIVALLNGPTFLAAYLDVPVGAAVDVMVLLVIAGVCGHLISLCVDRKPAKCPGLMRRCAGGLLFGIAFVTFQPRLLPIVSGIILNLAENTPLASMLRILFTQPYVFIATALFAGTCSLVLELGWQAFGEKDFEV